MPPASSLPPIPYNVLSSLASDVCNKTYGLSKILAPREVSSSKDLRIVVTAYLNQSIRSLVRVAVGKQNNQHT